MATLQESVTVTGESPVVDVTTTAVGTTFDAAKLAGIPSATDMWAVLSQSPGVRMQGYDVGGSHKSQAIGYEGFGVRGQSQFTIDGIQSEGNYPNALGMEEIAVSAAGGDVEINSPGAAIALTIKSGGNTFRSLNNVAWQPESFSSNNVDDETAARGFTGNPNLLYVESHNDLGGPIMRDKLWFFVSYNYFKIDKVVSGIPQEIATDLGHLPRGAGQAHLQAVAGRHAAGALPVGLQVQAAARPVGDHAEGVGARAGQPVLDRQGAVAARVVEPPVHRRALRLPRLRLADARPTFPSPRARRASTPPPTSTPAPAGTPSTTSRSGRRAC